MFFLLTQGALGPAKWTEFFIKLPTAGKFHVKNVKEVPFWGHEEQWR